MDTQTRLHAEGTPRTEGPVRVDTTGHVYDGTHAVRAAADAGEPINATVANFGLQPGNSLVIDVEVLLGK